jgi:diaminopimelate epimerase
MRIEFTKMAGAGNDFVVLGPAYIGLTGRGPELARHLCRRRASVGADGLIVVDDKAEEIFMHYFNRDGSKADFCGNGARCLVYYCAAKGIASGAIAFRSGSGRHEGEVTADGASITMQMPVLIKEVMIDAGGSRYQVTLVDSGVPHAVILTQAIDSLEIEALGPDIRFHPTFGSEGANVDFVDIGGGDPYAIRTYERGVEGETLACGSGCVAAAQVLRLKNLAGRRVGLRTASGDELVIEFPPDRRDEVLLSGPVCIVYEGEIEFKE